MRHKSLMLKNMDSFLVKPVSWFEPLCLEETFFFDSTSLKSKFNIHVDLGAGDGAFICVRAKNNPETYFLAVERLLGRVRKISRGAYRDQLENLRVLRVEAFYAVKYLFSPHSMASMTILFPDPWPKRRHHPHRLIQLDFLEACAKCLRKEGWLAIKTDDEPYFQHMTKVIKSCPHFSLWNDVAPADLIPETTDFEKTFLKAGRPIYFIAAHVRN